jgi:hypothetical protein
VALRLVGCKVHDLEHECVDGDKRGESPVVLLRLPRGRGCEEFLDVLVTVEPKEVRGFDAAFEAPV